MARSRPSSSASAASPRAKTFDLVVLGGGSAGFNAARVAADLGKSVAIVDGAPELGGLCILKGCMPSKTLLHAAAAAYNDRAEVRQIEPYVHSQTTYATCSPNAGKSRVPWLTGTVSWSYFSAVQYILGIRPEVDGLRIDPCIPSSWPDFEMERVFRGKRITIRVQNPERKCRGVKQLVVGGKAMPGNLLPLESLKDGLVVEVKLEG